MSTGKRIGLFVATTMMFSGQASADSKPIVDHDYIPPVQVKVQAPQPVIRSSGPSSAPVRSATIRSAPARVSVTSEPTFEKRPTISYDADAEIIDADTPIEEDSEYELIPKGEKICCTSSSWYLRGDITYSFNSEPSISQGDSIEFSDADWDDNFAFGLGIGYRFTENIRVDITGDYRFSSEFSGRNASGETGVADVDSIVFLANAYYDIGEWYGVRPYVGAGVGFVYHNLDSIDITGSPNRLIDGDSSTNFAGALMAGVGYAATENIIFDVGYRYLYLGDLSSGTGTSLNTQVDAFDFESLSSHEIRVGFRYEFGEDGPLFWN